MSKPDDPTPASMAPAPAETRALTELEPTVPRTPVEPGVSSLELERLRRAVKSRLFGSEQAPVSIDRYRILGCVGQGGMGIVYAARDERLGRTVALKLLRPEFGEGLVGSGSPGQGGDLTKEARSLAKLSHPNVVAVFDVGEHDGQLFVAMEYVDGQSLRRWLDTPRALTEILDVYLAAGEGLAAAHRAGLVHRDFKPDNVLVGADGRPRILDFGLARGPDHHRDGRPPAFAEQAEATATSFSRHGVLLGTPAYMAPEQHLGERADARSDQFGFCVALYQALYRSMPFPCDDLRSLSLAIVAGKLTPAPAVAGLPDPLRRLVMRGLAVDPDARYPSMNALLSELRDIRRGFEQLGRAPMPAPAPPKPEAKPASEPAPEPVYDTRAIERALGVSVDGAGHGRPPLTESELADIADEVGLELRGPHEPSPVTPRPRAPLTHEVRSGERSSFGLSTTILAERELSAMPGIDTQRRVVRELERNLGGSGVVEHFETSLAWSNDEAEASVDRRPGGARMVLRRAFNRIAVKRRRRGMAIGGFLGFMSGAILTDFVIFHPIEPLLVFGGMLAGAFAGLQIARKVHAQHMNEERALLEWVGDRTEMLISAEQGALPAAASRSGQVSGE